MKKISQKELKNLNKEFNKLTKKQKLIFSYNIPVKKLKVSVNLLWEEDDYASFNLEESFSLLNKEIEKINFDFYKTCEQQIIKSKKYLSLNKDITSFCEKIKSLEKKHNCSITLNEIKKEILVNYY